MTDVKSTGETRIAEQVVRGLAEEIGEAQEQTARAVLTLAQSHADHREMERSNRDIDHGLWREVRDDIREGNRFQRDDSKALQDTMSSGFDRVVDAVNTRNAQAPQPQALAAASDSIPLAIPKKWIPFILVLWLGGDTGKDLVVKYLTGGPTPVASAPASGATPSKGDGS